MEDRFLIVNEPEVHTVCGVLLLRFGARAAAAKLINRDVQKNVLEEIFSFIHRHI
jgi:hypothetical protein